MKWIIGIVGVIVLTSATQAHASSEGQEIFAAACAPCHGAQGLGDGPAASYLRSKPRDFQAAQYRLRSTSATSLPSQADVAKTIAKGMPGTDMPAWRGKLGAQDIQAVAGYVLSLAVEPPKAPIEKVRPASVAAPAAGELSAAQERGRGYYLLFGCWGCHGKNGRGDGPAAAALRDADGKSVHPRNFREEAFRSGSAPKDIFGVLATGLAGTPMPVARDLVAMGREVTPSAEALKEHFPADELARVATLRQSMQSGEELAALDEKARHAIVDRRTWDLVSYVRSLSTKRGVVDYLFDAVGRTPNIETY